MTPDTVPIPAFETDNGAVRIYRADARRLPLADGCVQCCVTSPPYFGLRDYGVDGQIGLEETPEAYVAEMVNVFREVRRVLTEDGCLWLNIGDSYASGGGSGIQGKNGDRADRRHTQRELGVKVTRGSRGGHEGKHGYMEAATMDGPNRAPLPGIKPKDLIGIPWMLAFALREPWVDWRIKSEAMRAWVGGIVDGEGCITISRTKSSHSESYSFPPIVQVRMTDLEPLDRLVEVAGSSFGKPQMPPSHAAANQRESYQWKVVSESAARIIAEVYPYLTCKRKQAIVAWNHQQFRTARGNGERRAGELEKEQFCKELINKLNQRQPVDIPSWMKEPRVVEEPGWYLRQDCIWHKPAPMPESVTDRCTKAHEYLFLLTKSPRYYFDADAIAEECAESSIERWNQDIDAQVGSDRAHAGEKVMKAVGGPRKVNGGAGFGKQNHDVTGTGAQSRKFDRPVYDKRNKRSVWTVAAVGYPGAHFATFPPALVEPCILAGSRPGDLVLDPFNGSGTTGQVARKWGRRYVGVELNPAYIDLSKERFREGVLFAPEPEARAS